MPVPRDAVHWRCEVDKQDIAYIVSLFEAYEDLAIVRTLDQSRGLIELLISPDYVDDTRQLLENLQHEIPLRVLADSSD